MVEKLRDELRRRGLFVHLTELVKCLTLPRQDTHIWCGDDRIDLIRSNRRVQVTINYHDGSMERFYFDMETGEIW